MGKDNYLCPCYKLTKKDIKKVIKKGALSFKEVKQATGISKRCGHCACKTKKYVKKQLEK